MEQLKDFTFRFAENSVLRFWKLHSWIIFSAPNNVKALLNCPCHMINMHLRQCGFSQFLYCVTHHLNRWICEISSCCIDSQNMTQKPFPNGRPTYSISTGFVWHWTSISKRMLVYNCWVLFCTVCLCMLQSLSRNVFTTRLNCLDVVPNAWNV